LQRHPLGAPGDEFVVAFAEVGSGVNEREATTIGGRRVGSEEFGVGAW